MVALVAVVAVVADPAVVADVAVAAFPLMLIPQVPEACAAILASILAHVIAKSSVIPKGLRIKYNSSVAAITVAGFDINI